jgi:hypothetical protein
MNLLDKALDALSFPLRLWDTVLPKHGSPEKAEAVAKQFWIPIWTSWILFLAGLGFGTGALLGKATSRNPK